MTKIKEVYRYIPKGSAEVRDDEVNAIVYLFTTLRGQPAAIAYSGKRSKHDFNYAFRST